MRPIDADALGERTKELVSRCMKMQWAGADLYVKYLRIVKGMIDSAPTIEQPPNDPLTLEELREMDGEPVWVEIHSNFDCIPHWALVHVHRKENVYLTERNCGQILFRIGDKVYRRKPEGNV